jgi:hypothetical protein
MKKLFGVFLLVGAILIASGMTGCATFSSVDGTAELHGLIISNAKEVSNGATEIGSYSVILGLVDSGYSEYLAEVKQAVSAGKKVSTVTTWYVVLTKTTAYAQ